jgi:predicted membrane protein
MDFLYFVPTVIIVIASYYMLDQRDQRERKERQAREAEIQNERAVLISRIQAPEATAMFAIDQEGLNNVRFDDDADFNKAMEMAAMAESPEDIAG